MSALMQSAESKTYTQIPRYDVNSSAGEVRWYDVPVWIDDAMRYWLERARRRRILASGGNNSVDPGAPLVSYVRGQRGLEKTEALHFEDVARQAIEVEESMDRMGARVCLFAGGRVLLVLGYVCGQSGCFG